MVTESIKYFQQRSNFLSVVGYVRWQNGKNGMYSSETVIFPF